MKNPEQDKLSRYISLVNKAYTQLKGKRKLFLGVTGMCVLLVGFTLLTVAENYWYLSPATKLTWIGITVLAAFGLAWMLAWYGRDSLSSFFSFYNRFADDTGLANLKYSFDLQLYSREEEKPLTKAAIRKNIESIEEPVLQEQLKEYAADTPESRRLRYAGGLLSAALIGLLVSGFTLTDAFQRSLAAWKAFERPNPYTFTVEPGDVTLEQGGTLTPTITFSGEMPRDVRLGFKTDVEDEYRYRPAEQTETQTATFAPVQLNTDASWFIEMDGFRTPVYHADVQLRPRFEELKVNVVPPSYTGLDSTTYHYPFSNIRAYKGSDITVEGIANKPLARLMLYRTAYPDTSLSAAGPQQRMYTFRFEMARKDTLHFAMNDSGGLSNNNSFQAVLDPVEDEYPFVQILRPEKDLEVKNPGTVDIRYEASDDFGLTSAALHYRHQRAFTDIAEEQVLPLRDPEVNTPRTYSWDLTKLDPKPRDVITFWIEVKDNDRYTGAKTGKSRELRITIPSLTTYLDEIEEKERDVAESLEEVSDSYEQMKQEYERFKEQLKENPQTNWEQKQTLNEVQKQQEKMQQQVEELNKKFEEIRRQIKETDMMSEETMKAYDELKKLMDEIDDPAFRKAMEELQKAMDSMSQRELREALENFEFNEQTYRERLNRTIQLFKTLKMNSSLEKLATALEDLARQEEELSESDQVSEESLKKQQAIQEDTKQLEEQVDSLANDPPDDAKEQIERLQQETEAQMEQVNQELQENIEKMQKSLEQDSGGDGTAPNTGEMQKQMQRMQMQMQMMASNARASQQSLNQNRDRISLASLQYILVSLINLSENQEELTRQTEHLASRSGEFVEKAREQNNIKEQFSHLADSLFKVSSKIPSFSNRINEKKTVTLQQLEQAVEQLSERSQNNSTTAQRQVLGSINELGSMIANLLESLMSQQMGGVAGAGSMSQMLQQMSKEQLQLNQQIQNLINDIQGDRLTRDQMDRMNQLARQQRQLREQIRNLQQNGDLESGDRLLSELERMAQEMEDAINDLRGGQLDRTLVERQQNILSRMLSAERALQERDKKEEREGTTASDSLRVVPPEVTLEELQKKIRAILNDPNRTKFTEDYQRLIEEYFKLLRELRGGTE